MQLLLGGGRGGEEKEEGEEERVGGEKVGEEKNEQQAKVGIVQFCPARGFVRFGITRSIPVSKLTIGIFFMA